MIQDILKNHGLSVLTGMAVVFLAAIILCYGWGIGYLVSTVSTANNGQVPVAQAPKFDITSAASIDYRGIQIQH